VQRRLGDVGLKDAGGLTVGKYSGGMRRRISVALSTMGDPKVMLMDEPTTGMDPVSRRHVWSLIQYLKNDKVIIMSTHAMEEAEILSDKLIVLDHGELKCAGTPLQLKNMLGKGYRINMICEKQNVKTVKELMKTAMPNGMF
jgi:ABC-type multidrug transport system ATPase subunit